MNQPTLFNLEAFSNTLLPAPASDPFWDEIETAPEQTHSVGGQITEFEFPYKSVGEQVLSDTLKVAPQHDTHWVEEYWVERGTNKYWYYRYCWMVGRKIHRRYIGSVNSIRAKQKKSDVEIAISDGQPPNEIEELLHFWKVGNVYE